MDKLSKENQEWLNENMFDDELYPSLAKVYAEDVEAKLLEMESKLKQANEWISVEDRLPETGRYLCNVIEQNSLGKSQFIWNCGYNEHDKVWNSEGFKGGETITHWKPLPKPPTGE